MQIKQSPQVSRAVEQVSTRRRWPWVLLLVIAVLIIAAGGIFLYYYFGGRESQTDNDSNNTNETQETSQGETGEIKLTPDPEDMLTVVHGIYQNVSTMNEAANYKGPLSLVGSTLNTEGLNEDFELFNVNLKSDQASQASPINGNVSPNGQFLALLDEDATNAQGSENVVNYLTIYDIETGQDTSIEDQFSGMGLPVWSDDSSYLIFSKKNAETGGIDITTYALQTKEKKSEKLDLDDQDIEFVFPLGIRNQELFLLGTSGDQFADRPIYVVDLDDNYSVTGEPEKLIEISTYFSRNPRVSSDGKEILYALSPSGAESTIEMFNRETGEVTTLRSSTEEEYSSPLFINSDSEIVYRAKSGIWKLNLESEERTQIIATDVLADTNDYLELVTANPSGDYIVVAAPDREDSGSVWKVYGLATNLEEATIDDLIDFGVDKDLDMSYFGWTDFTAIGADAEMDNGDTTSDNNNESNNEAVSNDTENLEANNNSERLEI